MKTQFKAVLTGSDSEIEGIVTKINCDGYGKAYESKSIDGTLHLVITRDKEGKWIRIAGTEPYLSAWTDELAFQTTI